jgi:hypothetical protein
MRDRDHVTGCATSRRCRCGSVMLCSSIAILMADYDQTPQQTIP